MTDDAVVTSRQVCWWEVHDFVEPRLTESWPMVGTPAWCELDDADPRKWAALLDAARHWALRVETCQVAECEASRELSVAEDWSAIAAELRRRNEFIEQNPWARRRPA